MASATTQNTGRKICGEDDARRMAELGITYVRIGEFAWSRIEPEPGRFDWAWLDRAVEVLGSHGLKIVMGTPTATPPKWLIDRHPDILPVDASGQVRGFGSRRHYSFSSKTYWAESRAHRRSVRPPLWTTTKRWPAGRPTMNTAAITPSCPGGAEDLDAFHQLAAPTLSDARRAE